MADLENGLWAGNERVNNNNQPMNFPFVMAMVKGGSNGFALKGGDATQGTLTTLYDGPRPQGYQPMKKQGAIILGWCQGAGETRARAAGACRGGCLRAPPPVLQELGAIIARELGAFFWKAS